MPSYLPMMFDVNEKVVLLVGGGAIAHEKLGRICELGCSISVIATEFSEDMLHLMKEYNIKHTKREYLSSDLEGVDIVIAAVNDQELQKRIFFESNIRKVMCNAVDLAEYCHFIFPSVIRRDDLVVAISTSGASPAMAKHLRRFFEKLIPESIGEFLHKMRCRRAELPKGKERMKMLDEMAKEYVEQHLHR